MTKPRRSAPGPFESLETRAKKRSGRKPAAFSAGSGRFSGLILEGYGGNVVVIFARRGAPQTAIIPFASRHQTASAGLNRPGTSLPVIRLPLETFGRQGVVLMHIASKFLGVACFAAGFAVGIAQSPAQPAPTPGDPHKTIPERIEPTPQPKGSSGAAPGTSGETLSDRLNRHDGVLRPPETNAPDMRVPAPNPNPNTTPVIPPPGSPGNPSPIEPK